MIIVHFKTVVIVRRESRMTSAKMAYSLATGRKYNTSKYNPEHHHTHNFFKETHFCAFFETDSSLSTPSASSPTTSVNSPSGNCRDSRIVKYCIQIYFYINANQLKKIS